MMDDLVDWSVVGINITTTMVLILLFNVVAILMPTTDRTTKSSIISPSPYLSRTRSFTMANYTVIVDVVFSFSDHPTCPAFSKALSNTYTEPIAADVVAILFTDAGRTAGVADVVTVFHASIIDMIIISSTADCTVVASIINSMLLFVRAGNI